MAYMSQERKKEIAEKLKAVMPAGWKYSLSVRHHSTIVLTVQAAPVDLVEEYNATVKKVNPEFDGWKSGYVQVNEHWIDRQFEGERLEQMRPIVAALNAGNHDRSDVQTDYFDVGWYVDINFGHFEKPFRVLAPAKASDIQERIAAALEEQNRLLAELAKLDRPLVDVEASR